MAHVYGAEFYDYINPGSRLSAKVVVPLVRSAVHVATVLDVGAGQGAWAAEWLAQGATEVTAVDGHYAGAAQLLIPDSCFVAHDLSTPLELGRRFDLVQSLEVAEHIPQEHAECFVDTLVAHGDVVLFSAAVPHQGGEHHVNEQMPDYWRRKFAARGYTAFDWLRPQLRHRSEVAPWYRFNTVLYANEAGLQRLTSEVQAARVADGKPLAIGGDLRWTLRRNVVRLMPRGMVDWVAAANAAQKARAAKGRAA
jgi:SAM-dependent methyltransferase